MQNIAQTAGDATMEPDAIDHRFEVKYFEVDVKFEEEAKAEEEP